MLRVDDRVWLVWAVWVLLLPLNWLAAAACGAVAHEACHMAAVVLLGGRIRSAAVGPFGAEIQAEGIGGIREAVCALAGPLGSCILVLFIRRFPLFGLCGLFQGLFNLLPVYPMDGGRALRRILERLVPGRADGLCRIAEGGTLLLLNALAAVLSAWFRLGIAPVLFCIFMTGQVLLRKRP